MSGNPNAGEDQLNVFINCPYDDKYSPIMEAIVFAIIDCGFYPRCALETNDATQTRFEKLCDLIQASALGIHDISRFGIDTRTGVPRFNMLFELGLYLGASLFAPGESQRKATLILDSDGGRYRAFVSDLAGQDIAEHGDRPEAAIVRVRDFLQANGCPLLPGGRYICSGYLSFRRDMPAILKYLHIEDDELTFLDRIRTIGEWLQLAPEAHAARGVHTYAL